MHFKFLPMLFLSIAAPFLVTPLSQPTSAQTTIIRVPSDFSTIQEAINAASPGNTILVNSGVYHEHLIVNKTLKLIGADSAYTILDGGGGGTVVIIKADNVLINGFTIQNSSQRGIYVDHSTNLTLSENTITLSSFYGLFLNSSSSCHVSRNMFLSNRGSADGGLVWGTGVRLDSSHQNVIEDNIIADSEDGITLFESNNTVLQGNTMAVDVYSIYLSFSNNSMIHHNMILNDRAGEEYSQNNFWNDGSEGNYWDNYTGLDDGSSGRIAGDGVGDADLPHLKVEYQPLVRPPRPVPVVWRSQLYPVALRGNSTISTFRFVQKEKKITFDTTGPAGTIGYCNVTIPRSLLRDNPWTIMLSNANITPQATIAQNQTHTFIHFTYSHSAHHVEIIGTWVVLETPTVPMLIVMMLILTFALALLRKKASSSTQAFF